jgi:hypothetical protein
MNRAVQMPDVFMHQQPAGLLDVIEMRLKHE